MTVTCVISQTSEVLETSEVFDLEHFQLQVFPAPRQSPHQPICRKSKLLARPLAKWKPAIKIEVEASKISGGKKGVKMTLQQITIGIPEKILLAEKTDAESFGHEILVLAAVKLFEIGRLSSGRASELAGMSRIEFLLNLNRYKVFPFAAELEDLENAHA